MSSAPSHPQHGKGGATAAAHSAPSGLSRFPHHSQYSHSVPGGPDYPITPYNTPAPYSVLTDAQNMEAGLGGGGGGWGGGGGGGGGGWGGGVGLEQGVVSASAITAALQGVSEESWAEQTDWWFKLLFAHDNYSSPLYWANTKLKLIYVLCIYLLVALILYTSAINPCL